MIETELYNKALDLAMKAHEGQKRKNSVEDYIHHPIRVAKILFEYGASENEVVAGVLHDSEEDTRGTGKYLSIETIKSETNETVGNLVYFSSGVSKLSDGNRKTRKQLDLNHYLSGTDGSLNIKLADTLDNLADFSNLPADFAKKYLAEKEELVDAIIKAEIANAALAFDVKIRIDELKKIFL